MKSLILALSIVCCAAGFASAAEKTVFGSVIWRYKVPNYNIETRYSMVGTAHYYNNRIYFICDYGSKLYCLDAHTGKKLWDFNFFVSAQQNCTDNNLVWDPSHPSEWKVPICMANEILIDDGRLFLGAHDGMDDVAFSCLFCIDPLTGKKLWRLPFKGSQALFAYGVSCGRVYYDNGCADEKTGRLLWTAGTVYTKRIGQSAFALASSDDQSLVYVTNGGVSPLYIISDTGHTVTTRKVNTSAGYKAFFPSRNGRCYTLNNGNDFETVFNCVDIKTGGIYWRYHLPGQSPGLISGTPLYVDDRIVLCYGRINNAGLPEYHVAALDSSTGAELWNKVIMEHPAMMGYITVDGSKVYFLEKPLNLACLDLETGKKHWSLPIGPAGDDAMTLFLAPAIHDGKAYVVDKVTSMSTRKILRSDIVCIDIGERH